MEAIVILSCHLWLQEEHMDPFFPDQDNCRINEMKVQETKVAQNESSLRSLSSTTPGGTFLSLLAWESKLNLAVTVV